ncbi:hypothetical protein [Amycolatopsis orientalis]|uniref:hypothetical protein n=1 Tax=Amycolatopsis orientalis TaxID=31958 RepID=UPI000428AEBF|nr:hypothetical protein [Amycolatopsis orientalis]
MVPALTQVDRTPWTRCYRGNPANGANVGATTWSWVNAETWSSFARKSGRVTKIEYLSDVDLGSETRARIPF